MHTLTSYEAGFARQGNLAIIYLGCLQSSDIAFSAIKDKPMRNRLAGYLDKLRQPASSINIPSIGIPSEVIHLEDVYIELRLQRTGMNYQRIKEKQTESMQRSRSALSIYLASETVSQVISRKKQIIILGEPGQGKTTIIRHYAIELARQSEVILLPILGECGRGRGRIASTQYDLKWLRERLPEKVTQVVDDAALGVGGSNPLSSTNFFNKIQTISDMPPSSL